jgi:hypothetical protein
MRAWLSILVGLCIAALCGAVLAQNRPVTGTQHNGVSHAIFPTQTLPVHFDHGRHLRIAGVTCVRCHTGAATSEQARDRLVPGEATCTPCHAVNRANLDGCERCHQGWNRTQGLRIARVDIPTPNLRFSHRTHVARGQRCESCHGDMTHVGLATRLQLPTMASCLSCHRSGGTASGTCATCHLTQPDGTLQTRFAEGSLNPPSWMRGLHHDADFWFVHRRSAAEDPTRCAVCHRDDECAACHDGRVRDRRTHPNDYLTLHAVDARTQGDRCTSCHRQTTFCVACHQRIGAAMDSAPAARSQVRFHPAAEVWTGRVVTSRHHGAEARRSLNACVSCHAERDCVTCHASTRLGGGGFSPHGPGFANRCAALLRASDRPCRQCHEDINDLAARCL